MSNRNFEKELNYLVYSEESEHICYSSLFCVLKELVERIEQLEQRLDEEDEYRQEQND